MVLVSGTSFRTENADLVRPVGHRAREPEAPAEDRPRRLPEVAPSASEAVQGGEARPRGHRPQEPLVQKPEVGPDPEKCPEIVVEFVERDRNLARAAPVRDDLVPEVRKWPPSAAAEVQSRLVRKQPCRIFPDRNFRFRKSCHQWICDRDQRGSLESDLPTQKLVGVAAVDEPQQEGPGLQVEPEEGLVHVELEPHLDQHVQLLDPVWKSHDPRRRLLGKVPKRGRQPHLYPASGHQQEQGEEEQEAKERYRALTLEALTTNYSIGWFLGVA